MSQSTTSTEMPDPARPQHRFDVFLSHNTADKQAVEVLAARLEDIQVRPFLDKWHLIPGDPWQEALEEALDNSSTCAVFLGPTGLGAWQNEEMRAALEERAKCKRFRVIPVLLPQAPPQDRKSWPRFLRRFTCVDFRSGLDNDKEFNRFVAGIRGVQPGKSSYPVSSTRQAFVIVLSGTIKDVDKPRVEAIAKHLREITSDFTLTIDRIEPGSIRLTIESSKEAYDEIHSRFEQGILDSVEGFMLLNVEPIENTFGVYPDVATYQEALSNRERAMGLKLPSPTGTLNYLAMKAATKDVSFDMYDDGLSPATVLAESIFTQGAQAIAKGANVEALKRGIRNAVDKVVAEIRHLAVPINPPSLVQLATVSADGDQAIGTVVANALNKVGKQGMISVEIADSPGITLEFVKGMQFKPGYLSTSFVNDQERMECVLENPFILLHAGEILSISSLLPLLGQVSKYGRSLLIITEGIAGDAIGSLVVNAERKTLSVAAVKLQGFGRRNTLRDIAVMTGGKLIGSEALINLTQAQIEDLGSARKVIISKAMTTLIDTAGTDEEVERQVSELRIQRKKTKSGLDIKELESRIVNLAGGVAVIITGAEDNTELERSWAHIHNSIAATRSAIAKGIVPSSGFTLVNAQHVLDTLHSSDKDEQLGINLLQDALAEPLFRISQDIGEDPDEMVRSVREETQTRRSLSREDLELFIGAGAIEPAPVVSAAVENAAIVAISMFTVDFQFEPGPLRAMKDRSAED